MYNENIEEKSDAFAKIMAVITYIVLFAIILASVYKIFDEKNETFIKEHTYDVETYVCYVTDYGSKYHAGYCQYLYSSKIETTVYRATRRGYTSCSRCYPTERTQIEVYDENGDTPPMKTANAVKTTLIILLLSSPIWYYILFRLLKKIYISIAKYKTHY